MYPYDLWLDGTIKRLLPSEDYRRGQERTVVSSVNATARRNNWNVFCRSSRDPRSPGILIWGDQSLPRAGEIPDHVRDVLGKDGYAI